MHLVKNMCILSETYESYYGFSGAVMDLGGVMTSLSPTAVDRSACDRTQVHTSRPDGLLWPVNLQHSDFGAFSTPSAFPHSDRCLVLCTHLVGEHKLFTVSPTSNTEWRKKREGLLSVSLRCSRCSLGCITCFDREILLQEIFMIFYLDHHWRVTSSMSLMSEVKVVPIMHSSFLVWLGQIRLV